MEKIGVTAARDFADIDTLACAIAYSELLNLEGKDAAVFIPEELNSSITDEIKTWGFKYEKEPASDGFSFVIVDSTIPEALPSFVAIDKIVELYDHHTGYENFWKEKLGDRAKIEMIGACATLIWEEFKKRGFADKISQTSARLLYAAIVSNTLNFKVVVTTPRDAQAFKEISVVAGLPKNWIKKYFIDQEQFIYQNPREAIINDTKLINFENLGKRVTIGQLELWNSEKFILQYGHLIKEVLDGFDTENPGMWFFNAPCISTGKDFIYTENDYLKKLLTDTFGVKFRDGVGEINRLTERKEFVKKMQSL